MVRYFYTNVINGINIEILNKVYDQIIEETELNPNLEKVFEYLKKERGITKIPLFVLSLNTNKIIEKFYQKNIDFFKKHNVEIIGIIGNQIKTDDNNNIINIYEHVTDENKKDYIPSQFIILADDRETKSLIEKGINAINVQGIKFDYELLDMSFELNKLSQVISLRSNLATEYPQLNIIINEMNSSLKLAKLNWEQKFDKEKLSANIIKIKLVILDFYKLYDSI